MSVVVNAVMGALVNAFVAVAVSYETVLSCRS